MFTTSNNRVFAPVVVVPGSVSMGGFEERKFEGDSPKEEVAA
jgi:hypothetical protein